jgi:hypothetical protein
MTGVLAGHVKPGTVILHERRRWRVVSSGPVVLYRPRQDARTLTRLVLVPARQSGGRSRTLDLDPCARLAVRP